MPRGYPSLTESQKQEIINRIQNNGERVADLAKEFEVSYKSIYNLLHKKVTAPSALLELSKLKREKEELLHLVGQLVAESRLSKKKR
jgi:transposase-like protein